MTWELSKDLYLPGGGWQEVSLYRAYIDLAKEGDYVMTREFATSDSKAKEFKITVERIPDECPGKLGETLLTELTCLIVILSENLDQRTILQL